LIFGPVFAAAAGGYLHSTVAAKDASPTAAKPVVAPAAAQAATPNAPSVVAASPEAAGRYIVRLGGCNDCHTPGFEMLGDKIPESQWLTGGVAGFRGPWGTTYPSNLRLHVQNVNEDDFVQQVLARNSRPPMPWPSLHAMSDQDLRAVYRFIKSLGPAGKPAPEYVSPGEEPKTPYISFEPVFPKGMKPPEAQGAAPAAAK
jgi:mono/diheme cytochrome c family protein